MNFNQKSLLKMGIMWAVYILFIGLINILIPPQQFFISWICAIIIISILLYFLFVKAPKHTDEMCKMSENLGYLKGRRESYEEIQKKISELKKDKKKNGKK